MTTVDEVRFCAGLLSSGPNLFAETVALASISIPRTAASFVTVKSVGLELLAESSLRTRFWARSHKPGKVGLGQSEFLAPLAGF